MVEECFTRWQGAGVSLDEPGHITGTRGEVVRINVKFGLSLGGTYLSRSAGAPDLLIGLQITPCCRVVEPGPAIVPAKAQSLDQPTILGADSSVGPDWVKGA